MWPSEEWASRLYDLANWFLIVALIVGAASTGLLVWMGNVKEEYLKRDLAATNERAAHAEERAAEANLELAKLKTPRTLNPGQQKLISEALKGFAGTQFDMAINHDVEAIGLLPSLENALKSAGWIEIDWKSGAPIAEINFTRKDLPAVGLVSISGLVIQMHPEQVPTLGTAAQALASALDGQGIAAKAEPGIGFPNINTKAIHIVIGEKPK